MTVLIRTFPPSTNPNYGGIMQAWALQQALASQGFESLVDSTAILDGSTASRRVKLAAKQLLTALGSMRYFAEPKIGGDALNRRLFEFPNREIQQTPLFEKNGVPNPKVDLAVTAFIVGSDQVWRPDYVNVPNYLFDFLPLDDTRPRVAYAVSFGRGTAEGYSPDLVATTRPLAHRLTAVSVREESGVTLARDLWDIEAAQLVDPTMLLTPDRYLALLNGYSAVKGANSDRKRLVSYVLDSDQTSHSVRESVALALDAEVVELYRPLPLSRAEYRRMPDSYQRIPVEEWLSSIATSDAVVTDSFHGAVFSILFNRPFLVKVNHTRGSARFDSLLGLFGLRQRVAMGDGSDPQRMQEPIDWNRINDQIKFERDRGLAFLSQNLTHTPGSAV